MTRDRLESQLWHYRGLLLSSYLSRIPLGMAAVGLLTVGLSRGLGAGVSGTTVALYAIGVALAGPAWAVVATRVGARRVLSVCLLGQLTACAGILISTLGWALSAAGACLGATTPPLAAMIRATWNREFADDAETRSRLAVFETINTEVMHISGRLLVAVAGLVSVLAIPIMYAVSIGVGLGRLRRDERIEVPPAPSIGVLRSASVDGRARAWGAVMFLLALSHGSAATAMVAVTSPTGDWRGALTLAVWGIGSILGGLFTLRRGELASPVGTLLFGSVLYAVVAVVLAASIGTSYFIVLLLVLVLGAPISPTVSAVFRGAEHAVSPELEVALFAVFVSLNFTGFALGSAAAGWATALAGQAVGMVITASAALAAVLPVARRARQLAVGPTAGGLR